MIKKIFIINGSGGVGKDTFVECVSNATNAYFKKLRTVWNYSSIDLVKEAATKLTGVEDWSKHKTSKDRKFLYELKMLATWYNDAPFNSINSKVAEFKKDEDSVFLFLHIREPYEIKKAVNYWDAKSILIVRDNIERIVSNDADKNVFNYDYDEMIINNGSLGDLQEYANQFVLRELGVESKDE